MRARLKQLFVAAVVGAIFSILSLYSIVSAEENNFTIATGSSIVKDLSHLDPIYNVIPILQTNVPGNQQHGNINIEGNGVFGKVGAGTTTPATNLHVVGTSTFSGNVGIGTTTPAVSLHVVGSSTFSGNVAFGDTIPKARLHISSNESSSNIIAIFESDIASVGLHNEIRMSAAGNTSPAAMRYVLGNSPNGSELAFLTQPSDTGMVERVRIDQNGNVGIGTPTPSVNLHVIGTASFSSGAGIGTTLPLAPLHLSSTASSNNTIAIFESDIASGGLYNEIRMSAAGNTSPAAMRYVLGNSPNSSELTFLTQPSDTGMAERVRIDQNGNVGIGTTNPQGKLDVNGAIYQRGSSLHADYVFESDYKLEPISEHSEFMWENKHLKAIPKSKVDKNGIEVVEIGSHQKGIVEELEKAHIYIDQLHRQINEIKDRLAKM